MQRGKGESLLKPTGRAVSGRGTRLCPELTKKDSEPSKAARAGRRGRVGLRGIHWAEMWPRFPLLARVNSALLFCTLVLPLQLSRIYVRRLPRWGSGAHTLWEKLRGRFKLLFHLGRGGDVSGYNSCHSLQHHPRPTICGSTRVKRGDSAGHQTGKGRGWAVAVSAIGAGRLRPYTRQKK